VSERPDWDYCLLVKGGEAFLLVIDPEGENTVDVRELEDLLVDSVVVVLEIESHVRIQHLEFHLHIICLIRNPLSTLELLNCDCICDVFSDDVSERGMRLSDTKVVEVGETEDRLLLEVPVEKIIGEQLIGELVSLVVCVREERVREQLERATKNDTGIISGLERGDQNRVLPCHENTAPTRR